MVRKALETGGSGSVRDEIKGKKSDGDDGSRTDVLNRLKRKKRKAGDGGGGQSGGGGGGGGDPVASATAGARRARQEARGTGSKASPVEPPTGASPGERRAIAAVSDRPPSPDSPEPFPTDEPEPTTTEPEPVRKAPEQGLETEDTDLRLQGPNDTVITPREFEQQFLEQSDVFDDPDEVRVERTEDGGVTIVPTSAGLQQMRESAAAGMAGIGAEDLRVTQDGDQYLIELTEGAQERTTERLQATVGRAIREAPEPRHRTPFEALLTGTENVTRPINELISGPADAVGDVTGDVGAVAGELLSGREDVRPVRRMQRFADLADRGAAGGTASTRVAGPRGRPPYSRFGGASEVEAPEDVQQFVRDVQQFVVGAEGEPGIVGPATTGGLFSREKPQVLEDPGALSVPDEAPGEGVENPRRELREDILRMNPELESDDVTVARRGNRYEVETDLDQEDIRELYASANPGVDPDDVTFRRTEDGEVQAVTYGEDDTKPLDLGDGPLGTQITGLTRRDVEGGVAKFSQDLQNLDIHTTATGAPIITGFDEESPDTELPVTAGGAKFIASLPLTADTVVAAGTGATTIAKRSLRDPGALGVTTTALARETAVETVESARTRPAETAGALLTGSVFGAAFSPVRFRSTRVPRSSGGATTLRGLRLETPAAARVVGARQRGTTIAGARGFRPTTGTPSVDPDTLDFSRLEGRGGAGMEPVGPFETDVAVATARRISPAAAERARAARVIGRAGSRARSNLNVKTTEEIVGEARAVPQSKVGDVSEALREIDAEIFGSAAVRAQIEGARQPRDVDIVVQDKAEARSRLAKALEGSNAEVRDVFDIKTVEEKPRPGETVKLGETAPQRLETAGGVKVTPASEELVKKAGASAFVRGPGFPETGPGLRSDIDIGPEPTGPPEPDGPPKPARVKDPGDAAAIARELFEGEPSGLSRANPLAQFRARRGRSAAVAFEELFESDIRASEANIAGLGDTDAVEFEIGVGAGRVRDFLDDTRGQVTASGANVRLRGADVESDDTRLRGRGDRDSPTGRFDTDADSPSAVRGGGDSGVASPVTTGSPLGIPSPVVSMPSAARSIVEGGARASTVSVVSPSPRVPSPGGGPPPSPVPTGGPTVASTLRVPGGGIKTPFSPTTDVPFGNTVPVPSTVPIPRPDTPTITPRTFFRSDRDTRDRTRRLREPRSPRSPGRDELAVGYFTETITTSFTGGRQSLGVPSFDVLSDIQAPTGEYPTELFLEEPSATSVTERFFSAGEVDVGTESPDVEGFEGLVTGGSGGRSSGGDDQLFSDLEDFATLR